MTSPPPHVPPIPHIPRGGPPPHDCSGPPVGEPHVVRGPAELLQAVPYLLGFRPADSLVVVGLAGGQVLVTARMDLALARLGLLLRTCAAMARAGADGIVAALFADELTAPEGLPDTVRLAADEHGLVLVDLVATAGGRYRSALCSAQGCCPDEGRLIDEEPTAFAVAATVGGTAVLPDRDAVAALLDPLPGADDADFARQLQRAESAARSGPPDPGGDTSAVPDAALGRGRRAAVRSLFAAARRADEPGWVAPPDDQLARWAVALRDIEVRDALWRALDHERIDGRELWRHLARRCPSPYDAPALLLFGWASWRSGQGLLAGVAADRAAQSDPTYSAADLLRAAVDIAVDPRRFPRLPRRRTA